MPHIIKRTSDLKDLGPVLDITVYPPMQVINTYNLQTQIVPHKSCIGLIDTGASISAIDAIIATELNLISRDQISILTPSGISKQFTFDIGLMLPKQFEFKTYFIEVTGADLTQQPYDVLIGRDVLQYCTLIFNGWDNSFQLHI